MKIIINSDFGGYSLSDEAVELYAKYKGLVLYKEESDYVRWTSNYYLCPVEVWRRIIEEENNSPIGTTNRYEKSNILYFNYLEIERNDPILVKVVEELGAKANGAHAQLKIVEIPDGVEYSIEDYDGSEHIAEIHRTWR